MPSSGKNVYAALASAFSAIGVRWYVFGAQAAIIHGAVRLTEDIDVTVDGSATTTSELVAALVHQGVQLRLIDNIESFVKQTRVLPMHHMASKIPIDVVLSGPGLEELFFEHLISIDVNGVAIPIVAAEDLIVMKILAGRPKDLEDVVAVLVAQKHKLDLNRTREILTTLDEALNQGDLIPALQAAITRAERT